MEMNEIKSFINPTTEMDALTQQNQMVIEKQMFENTNQIPSTIEKIQPYNLDATTEMIMPGMYNADGMLRPRRTTSSDELLQPNDLDA